MHIASQPTPLPYVFLGRFVHRNQKLLLLFNFRRLRGGNGSGIVV
jgi:hypothetical protein